MSAQLNLGDARRWVVAGTGIDEEKIILNVCGALVPKGGFDDLRLAARLQLDPAAPEFEAEIEGVTGDTIVVPGC